MSFSLDGEEKNYRDRKSDINAFDDQPSKMKLI